MANPKSNDSRLSRLVPFGLIGQTKPHHFREMLGVLWENRKELPYAWEVLNHGVCDGCSLGPYGLKDNVLDGVHLCMTGLKLLKLNTMSALDMSVMSDVNRLRNLQPERLRSLGRLPYPMIRRKGERGFSRVSWQEALDVVCKSIHNVAPHEMGFFATSRRLTNEVYYVFQKLARVLGTNNVDLCSRLCHAASVSGLKLTLGIGAATCSLADFIGTDLLVIFGSDLANNQPVTTKYMHYAKKAGTRILVVNPMREYGLERYWGPSFTTSALFGTKLMDEFFQVRVGGDIAFINGVLKALIALDRIDQEFVDKHTAGFAELKATLEQQSWEMLEQRSGLSRGEMQQFAVVYARARTAVIVYSIGFTQHKFGVDNVKAIVNLALSRGILGREKCGIMPIRGHSGVQGGGECGSEPDKFPGGFSVNDDTARRFSNLWHHPVPSNPGLKVVQMIEAAHRGEIKFLYSIGGNLLEAMPDWEIPVLIGRKSMPNNDKLFPFNDTQAIREEMARVIPIYQGIEKLHKEGDQFQWGGPYLYKDGFTAMPGSRALFTVLDPPDHRAADGKFYLATRHGKQFNSMTFGTTDRLTGTERRDIILISAEDAERLGFENGAMATLRSNTGAMNGIIRIAPVKPGTLQAYWPEANVLISRRTDAISDEPDYNTEVWLERT